MNQIPNIEETHNTREWEKEFDEQFKGKIQLSRMPDGVTVTRLKHFIHQELQKAREETIRDMERKMMGWSGTATAMLKDYRKIIYKDRSELDQDKK